MQYKIITISRELGSGGRIIGKKVADQLGYHFYDREIIDQTAKISGFSKEQILHSEEKITNSFLYNVAMGTGYGLGVLSGNGKESLPLNAQIYLAQRQAIQALAKKGPCVIVGRCADYVLRNQERVLRCYLYAPDAYRASSVASLNLSTASEYQPLIDEVDKARASYYLKYTGYPVDNLELRDLVVNTACLGLEGTVEMLAAFAAKKFGLNLKEQA